MPGLSKHNPIWDQTRASIGNDYVYEDDNVLIATDFECGNGHHIRRLGPGEYALDVEKEPGDHAYSGWGYYFCFGIRNRRREPTRVRVRVTAPPGPPGTNPDHFAAQTKHAVLRRGGEFQQLDPGAVEGLSEENAAALTLDLPAGDTDDPVLFVSNFHWHPISELDAWLDTLKGRDDVRVSAFAESVAGRPIHRVDIGPDDDTAPRILLAQTPQPSEMVGTWACRAVAEFLLSNSDEAREIRRTHHVTLVPATNPDGTVLGLGVSHPLGRFPYFEGKKTADGEFDALPEMKAMWDLLKTERPWLFIEWHGNNWSRRPGHMLLRYRPSLMKDEHLRRVWEDIDRRLEALPDTHHGSWTTWDEGGYQDSIGFMAVTRLDRIAYMIKHHDKFPLKASTDHAVACLREAVAAYGLRT